MSNLTMQGSDLESSLTGSSTSVPPPKAEDEGLSLRQIKWIPVLVPLAALTMLIGAAVVLGTA